MTDVVFILDIIVQLRTGYLEQGLMVSIPMIGALEPWSLGILEPWNLGILKP